MPTTENFARVFCSTKDEEEKKKKTESNKESGNGRPANKLINVQHSPVAGEPRQRARLRSRAIRDSIPLPAWELAKPVKCEGTERGTPRRRPLYRAAPDAETATRPSRPPQQPSRPGCRSIPSYLSTRELPEVQANGLWSREAACRIRREVGGPASLFTGLAHEEVSSGAASTVTRCLTLEFASHRSEELKRTTTTFLLENATSLASKLLVFRLGLLSRIFLERA